VSSNSGEKQGSCRLQTPRKRAGQAQGPRCFKGKLLGVAELADLLGTTPKTVRSRVSRGLLPFHRWGGRILFLAEEVEFFFKDLPGVSADEALKNLAARQKK